MEGFAGTTTRAVEMSTRARRQETEVKKQLEQAAALPPVISLIPDP
jgi:hypothetical protein